MSETRLNELDKSEWFDVARRLSPGLTWEAFSIDWDEFQLWKAAEIFKQAAN